MEWPPHTAWISNEAGTVTASGSDLPGTRLFSINAINTGKLREYRPQLKATKRPNGTAMDEYSRRWPESLSTSSRSTYDQAKWCNWSRRADRVVQRLKKTKLYPSLSVWINQKYTQLRQLTLGNHIMLGESLLLYNQKQRKKNYAIFVDWIFYNEMKGKSVDGANWFKGI